jgi:hypothetical protein
MHAGKTVSRRVSGSDELHDRANEGVCYFRLNGSWICSRECIKKDSANKKNPKHHSRKGKKLSFFRKKNERKNKHKIIGSIDEKSPWNEWGYLVNPKKREFKRRG